MKSWIGSIMLVAPFVGIFVYAADARGWVETGIVFGAIAILVVWIGIAVNLLFP